MGLLEKCHSQTWGQSSFTFNCPDWLVCQPYSDRKGSNDMAIAWPLALAGGLILHFRYAKTAHFDSCAELAHALPKNRPSKLFLPGRVHLCDAVTTLLIVPQLHFKPSQIAGVKPRKVESTMAHSYKLPPSSSSRQCIIGSLALLHLYSKPFKAKHG